MSSEWLIVYEKPVSKFAIGLIMFYYVLRNAKLEETLKKAEGKNPFVGTVKPRFKETMNSRNWSSNQTAGSVLCAYDVHISALSCSNYIFFVIGDNIMAQFQNLSYLGSERQ